MRAAEQRCNRAFGEDDPVAPVYLPKDLLEKLYERFALANPKGTCTMAGSQFEDYAPPA
jgi:hypothetical protein